MQEEQQRDGRYRLRPDQWGLDAWRYMTTYAKAYPQEPSQKQQEDAATVLLSIIQTLPCYSCRTHSTEILRSGQVPLDERALSSGPALEDFVYNLRQAVHSQANLPLETREQYEQVMNHSGSKTESPRGSCTSCNRTTPEKNSVSSQQTMCRGHSVLWWVLLILGVAAVGLLVYLGICAFRKRKGSGKEDGSMSGTLPSSLSTPPSFSSSMRRVAVTPASVAT